MRFSISILAVGFFVCGMPSWGQTVDSSSASSSDSYRERLKAASSDSQVDAASSARDSRDSYRERLRRLAEDDESIGVQRAAPIPKERKVESRGNVALSRTDAPESAAPGHSALDTGSAKPEALQHVSVQDGDYSPVPVAISQQLASQSSCHDEYCEQLRRTANGADLKPSVRVYDPGRVITTEGNFIKNLAFDQIHIWESPFKLRDSHATWALPFGVVVGSLIATDRDVSKQVARPSRLDTSKKISDLGLYSFIGAGAGFYGLGLVSHDDHQRETGLLAGEAFINASLVAEALKVIVGRQRPFEAGHFGHIGKGGSSFPSEHAIGSFAVATVFAHEYPNPFMQIAAYGLASAVSATRVIAGQHFPSDVLVGGAFGYLIGRKIYRDHHNPELGGSEYGTFVRERPRDAQHSGSAYVPLENWVYPVIDRLAALGFVHSNFDSERPFTRLECARIAAEAAENANNDGTPENIRSLVASLQAEFAPESEIWAGDSDNRSAVLESVYARGAEISGPVLRDGYHFGQTLYNDYGRPYGRGFNSITGFSARATSGPLVFYFRGEYQHAPGNPDYTDQQKAFIFGTGDASPPANNRFPAAAKFQVLDAYVGVSFDNNLLTLGQQSLWWGPGTGGPFMFTNNAVPLNMVRLSNVSPLEIPLLSNFLGPLRYDMFVGQTDGYQHILTPQGILGPHLGTQPFVQGQRFTFKPTPNFELGMTRTDVFGGSGYPLTGNYFLRTTFSTANYDAGAARKPGDRRSGFDVTYRIPKLRDRLTWYADEFSEDEISPLFFPRMSAMRSGIYAAKLPGLPRVDLRVEGVYTDVPNYNALGYFYFNATYKDGFTKDGNIMGDWIGRDGRGVNAASTIWFTARNSLQLGYREAVVDHEFLKGGRYQDESLKANFDLKPQFAISAILQYEQWRFPVLAVGPQRNFLTSLQFTYTPSWKLLK